MGVGDDELDAAQAAPGELAQELRPDRLGLRGADLHASTSRRPSLLTPTAMMTATRHDAAAAANLQVGGINP